MNKIDTRGLACPEPVLLAKKAVSNGETLVVLADNQTAVGNITRFAQNNGFDVKTEKAGEDFALTLSRKKNV